MSAVLRPQTVLLHSMHNECAPGSTKIHFCLVMVFDKGQIK